MTIKDPKVNMVQAAYELGADGILNDPSDDAICLAAAETALGNWPIEGLDRHLCERIVAAWQRGNQERFQKDCESSARESFGR